MEESELFLTRNEILEFRSITTLLSYTDVAETTDEGKRSGYVRFRDHDSQGEVQLWENLNRLVNILVRGVEVVAILPCSVTSDSNTLSITKNPDR